MNDERIQICPECGSDKYVFFDMKKRGKIMVIIALFVLLPLFTIIIPGGFAVSLICVSFVAGKGLWMYLRVTPYYICSKCLHWVDVNGRKLGK